MKKKIVSGITDFSRIALYLTAAGLLIWLNRYAFQLLDAVLLLLFALISLAVGLLLEKLVTYRKQAEWIVLGICCFAFWLTCTWWVFGVPYSIKGDQAIIWQSTVLALENDFTMFSRGGQMFIYPQQQGLAFLYEILFRLTGTTDYSLIGYVNAALAPLTLLFGYGCVKECGSTKAAVRFLPMMMLCLPYIIYSPYVYGDIPSICYSFIMLWAILKFVKSYKYRYGVLTCFVAVLALLSRMNIWIFFIGVTIGLCYHALRKWTWKPVVLAASMMLCAALSVTAVKGFNSMRSGYPVSKGMPSILWMTMGFQYSEWGAGYYNNYSKEVFRQADYDREQAGLIARQEIKERIKMFMEYPEQISMFFGEKLRLQWHDPFFEAIESTKTFDANEEMTPVAAWVYYGKGYEVIRKLSSHTMSLIYMLSLIGVISGFFKKRELLHDIPLIVFVGGFLFSIIWEAKSRYMLPYYILLHMYAAYGLTDISELLRRKLEELKQFMKK